MVAKRPGPAKKKRKEPHMIVRELPEGVREITVDGHTWIERPATVVPDPLIDDDPASAPTGDRDTVQTISPVRDCTSA